MKLKLTSLFTLAAGLFLSNAGATEVLTHFYLAPGSHQRIEGTYQLPLEKSPINLDSKSEVKACLQSQNNPSVKLECESIHEDYGFLFLASRALNHRFSPSAFSESIWPLYYFAENFEVSVDPVTNMLSYSFEYGAGVQDYNCPSYSPSSQCGAMHITLMWNATAKDLGFTYGFSPITRDINIEMNNVEWADIHLTINNGPQLNYRLAQDGNMLTQKLPTYVKNGDVVRFHMTYKLQGEGAKGSDVVAVNIHNMRDYFTDHNYGGSKGFLAELQEDASNVILHYSLNGRAYENVYMESYSNRFFTYQVEAQAGDVLTYFYTYFVNGLATDTPVKTRQVTNW
jgi:hypothetical protein